MVQPSKFRHLEFEWDEGNLDEIAAHRVNPFEAEDCFYNRHRVYRNKRKSGRSYVTFKLIGKTNAGRELLVIFYLKEMRELSPTHSEKVALIRVITAWEI